MQEYAMQSFAGLNLILMLGVIMKVSSGGAGQNLVWMVVVGEIIALALGNAIAYVRLRKSFAEIFFVKDHFSLISVYEILFKKENHAFPLVYANPRLSADRKTISLTYNDQIITLYEDDWEDFEQIWNWLNPIS